MASSTAPVTEIEISQSASATGTTSWYDTSLLGNFIVSLLVTAQSGTTPTLDWTIHQSYDGSDNQTDSANIGGTFTQVTTTVPNLQSKTFAPGGDVVRWMRYIRIKWALGGTAPSYTKSIQLRSLSYKA